MATLSGPRPSGARDSAARPNLLHRLFQFLARLFGRRTSSVAVPPPDKNDDGIMSEPSPGSQSWPDPGPPPRV